MATVMMDGEEVELNEENLKYWQKKFREMFEEYNPKALRKLRKAGEWEQLAREVSITAERMQIERFLELQETNTAEVQFGPNPTPEQRTAAAHWNMVAAREMSDEHLMALATSD